MTNKILAVIPLAAALGLSQQARADVTTRFVFSGGGVSGAGTLTYDPSAPDSISGGFPIVAITGTFSDSNIGLNDIKITGLVPAAPAHAGAPFPAAFGYFPVADKNVPIPPTPPSTTITYGSSLSYDNLFYPLGNAPLDCPDYPGKGGLVDTYGVLFTIAASGETAGSGSPGSPVDVVDVFSNGSNIFPAGVPYYGVAVANSITSLDYVTVGLTPTSPGVVFDTPEPSTWAMMILGFAGLSFAGYRRARPAVSRSWQDATRLGRS